MDLTTSLVLILSECLFLQQKETEDAVEVLERRRLELESHSNELTQQVNSIITVAGWLKQLCLINLALCKSFS